MLGGVEQIVSQSLGAVGSILVAWPSIEASRILKMSATVSRNAANSGQSTDHEVKRRMLIDQLSKRAFSFNRSHHISLVSGFAMIVASFLIQVISEIHSKVST